MKLQNPFNGTYWISQKFGANDFKDKDGKSKYQKDGKKGHGGVDFACPVGTPLFSVCDGKVILISEDLKSGLGVAVLSDEIFKYNGMDCRFRVIYWHLKEKGVKVKLGEQVKTGQLLGLSGNTGITSGPHLHLSLAPMAPDGSMKLLAEGNGYAGYIDPLPYLDLDTPYIKRIKALQGLLNANGAKLEIDGIYGKRTKAALEAYLTKT